MLYQLSGFKSVRGSRLLLVVFLVSLLVTSCGGMEVVPAQLTTGETTSDEIAMKSGIDIPKVVEPSPTLEQLEPVVTEVTSDAVGMGGGGDLPLEEGLSNPPVVDNSQPAQMPEQEIPVAPDTKAVEEPIPADLSSKPQVGFFAPDFSLQTTDGQTIQLSDFRGQPVLISYWTSWCVPCKNEMQILQNVYQRYQDQGFVILAVNAIEQDNIDDVNNMLSQIGVTYLVGLDYGNSFASSYNALFFPTSYFIDANGVIQDIALGDSPEAEFQARVDRFIVGQ